MIVRSFCSGWTIDEIAKRHRLPTEAIEEAVNLAAEAILEMYAVPYPEPVPMDKELVTYIRRFLRHPQFNTHAKRIGKVVRVTNFIAADFQTALIGAFLKSAPSDNQRLYHFHKIF